MVQARIDPQLKKRVEKILTELGVSCCEVINMLYAQIVLKKAVPFKINLSDKCELCEEYSEPNEETKKVLEESSKGKNLIECEDAEDMFRKLGI